MFKEVLLSLAIGFVIGLVVTEVFQLYTFFSLFLGIPVGIVTAATLLMASFYLKRRR